MDSKLYKRLMKEAMKRMEMLDPSSKEYRNIVDAIKVLSEVKKGSKDGPSADAILGAAASIGGIVLIICAEQIGIFASKALSFVKKPRF